jgi:hypothetical protein
MSKSRKPSTINTDGFSTMLDILKPVTNISGAVMVANAIREHTRAMIAIEYYKRNLVSIVISKKELKDLMLTSWDFADEFLAADKPLNDNSPTDPAA